MTRLTTSAALAAAALGWMTIAPPTASAQIAGIYQGTSADGQTVEFTVAPDTATGHLAITNATVWMSAPCRGGFSTLNTGWGYGLNADIVNRTVTNTTSNPFFNISFRVRFSADGQSATGLILSIGPQLYSPTGGIPTTALYCVSPQQALTLTYSGAAVAARSTANPAPLNVVVPR